MQASAYWMPTHALSLSQEGAGLGFPVVRMPGGGEHREGISR